MPLALLIGLTGLKGNHIQTLKVQLGCVLDTDDALGLGYLHRKSPKQCGFARA